MATTHDVTLFIDPFSYHFKRDRLFDGAMAQLAGDHHMAPYVYLRNWLEARGIGVHTADYLLRGEALSGKNIYMSFGMRENYRNLAQRPDVSLSAFFAFECPNVEPALYRELSTLQNYVKRIFSFSDGEARSPFCEGRSRVNGFRFPSHLTAYARRFARGRPGFPGPDQWQQATLSLYPGSLSGAAAGRRVF